MLTLYQVIINTILIGSLYTLTSLGLFVIYKLPGIINLAHGEFILIASYLAWYINRQFALDPLFALIVVIPLMLMIGYGLAFFYHSNDMSQNPMFALLITWGLAILLRNSFQLLFSTTRRTTDTFLESAIQIGLITLPVLRSMIVLIVALLIVVLIFIYQHTDTGRQIRFVSSNSKAAEMLGMPIKRIKTSALLLGMVLIGIAGTLISPIYALAPNLGQWLTIKCLAVVLLTGNRDLPYVWLSGLFIAFLEMIISTVVVVYGTGLTEIVSFIVIIGALLWNHSLRDVVRMYYARFTT